MLRRIKKLQQAEKDWYCFSKSLSYTLFFDYISCRLLYYLEPITTSWTILELSIGIAEKSLKMFVTLQKESIHPLFESKDVFGHNIEKLRKECSEYNPIFNEEDIKGFTADLNDKSGELHQFIKYGSQKSTDGFYTNINLIIPIIDKIFFKSILLLPENKRSLIVFTSLLHNLLTQSTFDQSKHPILLIKAIKYQNSYINEFIKYCISLDDWYDEGISP